MMEASARDDGNGSAHLAMAASSSISSASFAFPPLHNFAPFFTLQRNEQTLASQLATWTRLVLDYCQANRIFVLDVEGAWERTTGAGGLFSNEKLQRSLNAEGQRIVLSALVEQKAAVWDPPIVRAPSRVLPTGKSTPITSSKQLGNRALIFWRKPEEWGEQIYSWISATGQNGSILTFFELTEGDLVQDQGETCLQYPHSQLCADAYN